ncbi:MAG TPA: PQQ-binding-like beta-propeller repeat protein [Candidatus Saccharimonadales bacterium]|nr:PQQ-binding-like beta-propeller repeat protein [Candidatus Saccharimonadales bacterium]
MTSSISNVAAVFILCASTVAGAAAGNWPQFRGPDSIGVSDNTGLPDHWGTNQNVAWKSEVPGRGWSSPIIWGNHVFLTTVAKEGEMEMPKKGLYFGGERKEIPKANHQWLVLCYDLESGRELWRKQAHGGQPPSGLHVKNTYASETPVTDGQRLFAYFGNVGLFAYDLGGKPLWSTNWPPVKTRYGWGTAASPALHENRLFVISDNEDGSFLEALDAKTGRRLWRVERDEKSNWATPYIWRNEQRTEIITPGTKKVRSYDLDGKLLWEFGGMSSIVIPTPFSKFGLLYVCSGYVGDKVRPVFAIKPGASGDISLKPGESSNQFITWWQPVAGPYNPSPLVYGDNLYVLFDFGFLSCHDARTGKEIYGKQRVRAEGNTSFTASPWAADGKIFALSEDGDTYVFEAGPKYKLLYKNSLDEMCMATPALAGDRLLIRTLTKLYCLKAP